MTTLAVSDSDLLTLNCYEEARGEPDDGVAAIARVVLNRIARHGPQSDGTISGTILYPNAFSWTQWEMVGGKYTRVVHTHDDMIARVNALFLRAEADTKQWARCSKISAAVQAGKYDGADYARLTSDTVNYCNTAISHPAWASADKLVCSIAHHSFFRA